MCLKPVTLTRSYCDRWYRQFTVPCGKCEECVKDVQNEYVIRTVEEQRKRGTVLFITLTYNEGSVPRFTDEGEIDEETGEYTEPFEYRGLNRKDVVDWKKRVCQHYYHIYGQRLDFSYLICGEYGPKTHRPHYHGILLGLNKMQADYFIRDWQNHYGFVCAKFVPTIKNDVVKVARYCSKYICKLKEFDTMPSKFAERPRKLTSIGYGMPAEKRWQTMKDYYLAKDFVDYDENNLKLSDGDVKRLVDEIIKRRKYNLDGNQYKLPTYYRKKIFYRKYESSGNIRATQIQHLVSSVVQSNFKQDFDNRVKELKAGYNLRTIEEAIDLYNILQENERKARAETIRQNNLRYLRKAKVA